MGLNVACRPIILPLAGNLMAIEELSMDELSEGGLCKALYLACDYDGCGEPIRNEDRNLGFDAKKYCVRHGDEIDAIIRSGDAAAMLRWWVKSLSATGDFT